MVDGFRMLHCDALIGVGGDGSLGIFRISRRSAIFRSIGIPKTIDNDLEPHRNFDRLRHGCVRRDRGARSFAADRREPRPHHDFGSDGARRGAYRLAAGIAGGADVILIPEIPYQIGNVVGHIKALQKKGRNFALVVVSEAVLTPDGERIENELHGGQKRLGGIGHILGAQIADLCNAETRVTVLGHVQRGGAPSAEDRMLAAAFGVHAVDLIAAGQFNRMVAWSNRQVIDVPLNEAVKHSQPVEKRGSLVKTARGLGICFGDEAPAVND